MKRKAIRKDEYLAAVLACLLPQEQRDALRAAKVPAQTVIRLFSPDHIGLHCFEDPRRDKWHNLTPILRGPHKEKSRKDCAIAAKVKRLERQFRPELVGGMVALVEVMDRQIPRQARKKANGGSFVPAKPKRRIGQRERPWPPRGSRPMRWKDALCPR